MADEPKWKPLLSDIVRLKQLQGYFAKTEGDLNFLIKIPPLRGVFLLQDHD